MEKTEIYDVYISAIKIGSTPSSRRKRNVSISEDMLHLPRSKTKKLEKMSWLSIREFLQCTSQQTCHDQVCSLINDKHQFQTRVMNKFQCLTIARAIETIVINTRVHASLKLPTSVLDYLYRYAQIPITVPEDLKISASIYFSKSLTLFSALQKLNYNAGSKMVLHVIGELAASGISFFWEVLLHLLPNLIDLKIILIEHAEDVKYRFDVCQTCRSMKKTLDLESVSATYNEYVISEGFTKPDIVAMYNLDIYEPPEKENMLDNWDQVVKNCGVITCPWFLTVATEKMVKIARKKLRSHLKNVEIFYEGKNDFTPIKPELDWESEGVCWLSTFLMIMKPRDN